MCVYAGASLSIHVCLGSLMAVGSQEHLNPHFVLARVLQLLSAHVCAHVRALGGPPVLVSPSFCSIMDMTFIVIIISAFVILHTFCTALLQASCLFYRL